MKSQKLLVSVAVTAVLLLGLVAGLAAGQAGAQEPEPGSNAPSESLSTSFTYQGQLFKDGVPVNGACDIRFTLYDAVSDGSQVGPVLTMTVADITGGLFTSNLDFGYNAFNGGRRWLQVEARCPTATGEFVTVGDRQELTATPYALYAAWNWGLEGNAGTTPGTHYLGTSDDQALEIKVNGVRALRIEPHTTSPNLVGGHISNTVDSGIYGGTIGGGGTAGENCGFESNQPCWNQVTSNLGTIGGGAANIAGQHAAAVGGGYHNTANGTQATVGGGYNNTASGSWATVGGGYNNNASGDNATVGGGSNNRASGYAATVAGGQDNLASGNWSFAAGYRAKANQNGSFVWSDTTEADFASVADNSFAVRATGGVNMAVGSGAWRIEPTATSPNLVGGYSGNTVSVGAYGATIGGGGKADSTCGAGLYWSAPCWNRVTDIGGVIGGGVANTAGTYGAVGGGYYNTASGGGASIGGGSANTASGAHATVTGGESNLASGNWATVAGGYDNTASGAYSLAAGNQAQAAHQGSFVWGDSTGLPVASTAANQFVVRAYGGVKVVRGQSSFAGTNAALHVEQADTSGQAIYATSTGTLKDGAAAYLEATNTTGGIALWAKAQGSDTVMLLEQSANAGEFVKFYQTGPSDLRFKVTWDGVTYADGAYTTPAADFAELLPAEAGATAGDVLVIGPDSKLARSSEPYAAAVAGVYSEQPGFLGGAGEDAAASAAGKVPLAVVGVVSVKVSAENGAIRPGDLLTTSATAGHAMRCEGVERCFGRTLGKALEGLSAGTGVIKVLVMLQ